MGPTPVHGKICYIEVPASDVARSPEFYKRVSGWHVRKRGDGSTAFDDTTGQVSGTWVLGWPPIGRDAPEITARFRDPGGNVIGLYQERG